MSEREHKMSLILTYLKALNLFFLLALVTTGSRFVSFCLTGLPSSFKQQKLPELSCVSLPHHPALHTDGY